MPTQIIGKLRALGVPTADVAAVRAHRRGLLQGLPAVRPVVTTAGQRHAHVTGVLDLAAAWCSAESMQQYVEYHHTGGAVRLGICTDGFQMYTKSVELMVAYLLNDRTHRHSPDAIVPWGMYLGPETNAALLEMFELALPPRPASGYHVDVRCSGPDCAYCRWSHTQRCAVADCTKCAFDKVHFNCGAKEGAARDAARNAAVRKMVSGSAAAAAAAADQSNSASKRRRLLAANRLPEHTAYPQVHRLPVELNAVFDWAAYLYAFGLYSGACFMCGVHIHHDQCAGHDNDNHGTLTIDDYAKSNTAFHAGADEYKARCAREQREYNYGDFTAKVKGNAVNPEYEAACAAARVHVPAANGITPMVFLQKLEDAHVCWLHEGMGLTRGVINHCVIPIVIRLERQTGRGIHLACQGLAALGNGSVVSQLKSRRQRVHAAHKGGSASTTRAASFPAVVDAYINKNVTTWEKLLRELNECEANAFQVLKDGQVNAVASLKKLKLALRSLLPTPTQGGSGSGMGALQPAAKVRLRSHLLQRVQGHASPPVVLASLMTGTSRLDWAPDADVRAIIADDERWTGGDAVLRQECLDVLSSLLGRYCKQMALGGLEVLLKHLNPYKTVAMSAKERDAAEVRDRKERKIKLRDTLERVGDRHVSLEDEASQLIEQALGAAGGASGGAFDSLTDKVAELVKEIQACEEVEEALAKDLRALADNEHDSLLLDTDVSEALKVAKHFRKMMTPLHEGDEGACTGDQHYKRAKKWYDHMDRYFGKNIYGPYIHDCLSHMQHRINRYAGTGCTVASYSAQQSEHCNKLVKTVLSKMMAFVDNVPAHQTHALKRIMEDLMMRNCLYADGLPVQYHKAHVKKDVQREVEQLLLEGGASS